MSKQTRVFIRFAGFASIDEVHEYCRREGIGKYKVWTGADDIVRGSGEFTFPKGQSDVATEKTSRERLDLARRR